MSWRSSASSAVTLALNVGGFFAGFGAIVLGGVWSISRTGLWTGVPQSPGKAAAKMGKAKKVAAVEQIAETPEDKELEQRLKKLKRISR